MAGSSAAFVLQQHCIACPVLSLFEGTVPSFWGGVLLFWQRQCCLFCGIVVSAAAAVFLGDVFTGSICLVAALHRFATAVSLGFVWGAAFSFWGWCVVVLADAVLFVWWL